MWRFMAITFAFLGVAFYQLSGGSDYAPSDNSLQARAGSADAQAPKVDVANLDSSDASQDETATVTRAAASLADLELSSADRVNVTFAAVNADDNASRLPARTETVAASIEAAIAEANEEIAAYKSATGEEGATGPGWVEGVEPAAEEVPDSVQTGFIGEQVFSLETYVMRQNSDYTPTTEASLQGSDGGSAIYGDIRQVSGNSVNMRAGPGTDYQRVGSLSKGTEIAVLEEPGNGWVLLEVVGTGETGWMADWLITASN